MTLPLPLLVLLLAAAAHAASVRLALPDIAAACSLACPLQNNTEKDFDVGCGSDCRIEQCSRGCSSWQLALDSSCQNICNGTQNLLPPKQLYCFMGCNDALSRYFQLFKDNLGQLPAPALVADSLTATSLRLDWDGPQPPNTSILVQSHIEGSPVQQSWHYCQNQTWISSSTISVGNLIPYTKYRFRIALLLSPHANEPVTSEPSVVISTLPGGLPSSPPQIVRATAVDSSRISVSWLPGPFPNGPILSYVLHISEVPGGYSALKVR